MRWNGIAIGLVGAGLHVFVGMLGAEVEEHEIKHASKVFTDLADQSRDLQFAPQ